MSLTYAYMPETVARLPDGRFRHAGVPYWSGKGGVTTPGSGGVPYTNNELKTSVELPT